MPGVLRRGVKESPPCLTEARLSEAPLVLYTAPIGLSACMTCDWPSVGLPFDWSCTPWRSVTCLVHDLLLAMNRLRQQRTFEHGSMHAQS
jgi:hypothetical protein